MTSKTSDDKTVPQGIIHLINRIYDAALAPELWVEVLAEITTYFEARHSLLFDENYAVMTSEVFHGSLDMTKQFNDYNRQLVFNNPLRVPLLLTKNIGDIFSPTDLVPTEEYKATRYFKKYISPNQFGDALIILLDKSSTKFDMFVVTRTSHQPDFTPEDRRQLNFLVEPIRKTFLINKTLADQKKQIADLREAVNEVATAIFFTERNGRLVHMNDAARRIMIRNDVFRVEFDILMANGGENQAKFSEALTASPHDVKPEILLRSSAGEDYTMRILPLSSNTVSKAGIGAAAVMIFLKRVEFAASSSIELIAGRYRLTPREMSVLVAIVETGGVPDAAAVLGLGPGTVRGHLKSVFAKTGLNSQIELAKLVAAYASSGGRSPAQNL